MSIVCKADKAWIDRFVAQDREDGVLIVRERSLVDDAMAPLNYIYASKEHLEYSAAPSMRGEWDVFYRVQLYAQGGQMLITMIVLRAGTRE